jgi:hypothetical protein
MFFAAIEFRPVCLNRLARSQKDQSHQLKSVRTT